MESTVVRNPTLILKGFVSQLLHGEMQAPGGCADSADFDDQILHMISYYDIHMASGWHLHHQVISLYNETEQPAVRNVIQFDNVRLKLVQHRCQPLAASLLLVLRL